MIKEFSNKSKRRLLKAIRVCLITAAALGFLWIWYNINSSDPESYNQSKKKIDETVARSLHIKDPNNLTSEDYEKVEDISIYPLTNLKPLVKLKNLECIRLFYFDKDLNLSFDFKPLAKLQKLRELEISPIWTEYAKAQKKKKWYDKILSIMHKLKPSDSKNRLFDLVKLGKLNNLENLTIEYDEIGNYEALASFKKLVHLNLRKAKISDAGFFKELSNLRFLNLTYSQINDINSIKYMVNLERLGLSYTDITDINSLANLTNLKILKLFATHIDNIDALASLSNLQELDLSLTKVSDIKTLAKLTDLRKLTLFSLKITDISPLSQLTNLQSLNLSSTRVSDIKPLESLTNLTYLNLEGTKINDIKPLEKLTNLHDLILHQVKISDEQIAELQQALPELNIVK